MNGIVGIRMTWRLSNLYTYKSQLKKLDLQKQHIDEIKRDNFLFNTDIRTAEQEQNIAQYYNLQITKGL